MPPPRLPRPGTQNRDRDARETTAPPEGSELHRLGLEAKAAAARANLVPSGTGATPAFGSPLLAIEHRSEAAASNSYAAAVGVDVVRAEFQAADARIDKQLIAHDGKLDVLTKSMSDVRAEVSGASGELKILNGLVKTMVESQLGNQTMKITAELDLGKAAKTADIKVDTENKLDIVAANRWKRELVYKVLAWSTPLVAAAATAITLLAKRC